MNKFDIEIHYLKNSRRATIRVMPNYIVKVSVPFGITESQINKILKSKKNWILKKYKILESRPTVKKIEWANGEILPFLGQNLFLKIVIGKTAVMLIENELTVSLPLLKIENKNHIQKSVINWYKNEALKKINLQVQDYSSQILVRPASIKLKNYKSRWGACSSKKELIFNWQIVCFHEHLFKYVVAHEVCHLLEMNHSPRFYNLVSQLGFNKNEIHREMKHLKNIF